MLYLPNLVALRQTVHHAMRDSQEFTPAAPPECIENGQSIRCTRLPIVAYDAKCGDSVLNNGQRGPLRTTSVSVHRLNK